MSNQTENPKEAAGALKLPLQLCPPAAKREMALALRAGADKYGEWNWRAAGIKLMTYVGAMQRHLDAIHAGEWADPDSGLPHISHILANAAIVADAKEHDMLAFDWPANDACPPKPKHGFSIAQARERACRDLAAAKARGNAL